MKSIKVAVIDYGIGNLLSVSRGLEYCGAKVSITSDHEQILQSDRVVLPGVGAFEDGMTGLKKDALDEVVQDVARKGIPLLGICLGMQMLLDESDEFGITDGLGLIPGRVIPIPEKSVTNENLKVPHIGWNELVITGSRDNWRATIMEKVCPGDAVYFVHSFTAKPENENHIIAGCRYGGHLISATIGRDNVFGCQFHPEKSGAVGLNILRKYLEEV